MTIKDLQIKKKELGLTSKAISELSGIPLGTVNKVLGGFTKSPRYETVQAIERVLTRPADPAAPGAPSAWKATPGRYAAVPRTEQLQEAAAPYAGYIYGSTARKGYDDSYPGLPFKRQGEYTAADRDLLPPDVRTELIGGVLYDLASPKNIHQILIGRLYNALTRCIEESGRDCLVIMAPSDVWLTSGDKTIVQPDLYVLCGPDMIKEDGYTHGAPPLVIEILSASTASRDRGLKLFTYLEAGVQEYWIVDPQKKRILVYHFMENEGDALDPSLYSFDDDVPVGISGGYCRVCFPEIKKVLDRYCTP